MKTKIVDYANVKSTASQRTLLLGFINSAIGGLLMIAVFLMLTGFLYLIK